ncbi:aminoacyl-tRNA hydrolase [Candidatus Dependentiae bacterium]|nr:aminoacyl-tRNA hydrolase [Candidatus Dependentiae bacterium]MCC7415194.1 aminoacyl-tRNA hydrolase [Campylobacterota bacterium]
MKQDLPIKNGIVIPEHELEITSSRSGGAGGQHVNKTNSRITVRWNVRTTNALTEEQKERVIARLQSKLTSEGDLIIHHSSSRSQQQNKQLALEQVARDIAYGLHVPKKRMATRLSAAKKEARLQKKSEHSALKKLRSKKHHYDE